MGSCQVIKLHIIHVVTWREDVNAGIVCILYRGSRNTENVRRSSVGSSRLYGLEEKSLTLKVTARIPVECVTDSLKAALPSNYDWMMQVPAGSSEGSGQATTVWAVFVLLH